MVLESQTGRAGAGRMYMSSRRRRGSWKLPAVAAVVVVVGVVCWLMIRGSSQTPPTPTPGTGPVAGGGGVDDGGGAPRVDPGLTPLPAVDPTPPADPTPRVDPQPQPEPQPQPQPEPQPAAQPEPQPAPGPSDKTGGPDDAAAAAKIAQARQLVQENRLASGREVLNQVLASDISAQTAEMVRRELAALNSKLVFSPLIDEADPYARQVVIQPGQVLSKIASAYDVTDDLVASINRIANKNRIRAGQRIKVVRGPFHVVISKSAFRADLYLGTGADRLYVRSYRVGLGEFNSTPIGRFVVRKHSKLVNPEWVNPRTNQRFHPNDPKNPIGERWIGLQGDEPATKDLLGYGLHGTIDPMSIGRQSSMGCVRMLPDDIAEVFTLLVEEKSTVTIAP